MSENCIPLNRLLEGVSSEIEVLVCRKWDVVDRFGTYMSTDFILADNQDQGGDSVLPNALVNNINNSHVLEIKSHTYYQHDESFTCTNIIPAPTIVKEVHEKERSNPAKNDDAFVIVEGDQRLAAGNNTANEAMKVKGKIKQNQPSNGGTESWPDTSEIQDQQQSFTEDESAKFEQRTSSKKRKVVISSDEEA